jgi:hypothetical protein
MREADDGIIADGGDAFQMPSWGDIAGVAGMTVPRVAVRFGALSALGGLPHEDIHRD